MVSRNYHGPYFRTHLHIGDGSQNFARVDTTKGQFSILDQFRGRGLKGHRDEVRWDGPITKEVVCDCRDACV